MSKISTSQDTLRQPLRDAQERNGQESNRATEESAPPAPASQVSLTWRILILGIFVCLSSGQPLATTASSGPDGKLEYSAASAVTLAELTKCIVAVAWVLIRDREKLLWPVPLQWWREVAEWAVIAFLFALQNQLNFHIIPMIGAKIFTLLSNLKIVFTVLFMRTMMGKQFTTIQWAACGLILVSAVLAQLHTFSTTSVSSKTGAHGLEWLGSLLMIVSTALSGVSSVANELFVKRVNRNSPPFMAQMALLYAWGSIINFISWVVGAEEGFFYGYNPEAMFAIGCMTGVGLCVALVLKYLDNIFKIMGGVLVIYVTVGLSLMFPDLFGDSSNCVDLYLVFAFALVISSMVAYSQATSPRVWRYSGIAVSISLLSSFALYAMPYCRC